MASSQSYSVNLNINANAGAAKQQLKDLQSQLQQISNMKIDIGTGSLTADIEKASQAAMKLSAHLATATNPQTGNLDFTKFYTSIQKSGASLQEYGQALQNMGPAGQKAFVNLADSISKSEIPLRRTSKLVDGMWDNLKKTVGWQMSSSMVHGFIGSMQQAVGYAKDLNKSLTDIRIVTGASTDQMATFAKEANKAAKNLSTTTTDYTKASLIYYQQGLSDQEVKARTETTIKMANATGTSAQKVSDQMTAIWNNYDNGTKSLTHYADVMTALGAATASSTDEIAEGLQKFAAISDTVGLSYEYAASALATITATSRESADVVGNSLKTLFSRIQGLQLGETLDDGTTLNKYSTALAKVGISIKDSSGELKDMDLILDEMGNKWETLARDEQMALAQTVAGVRQYTQLMTLMENWDQFKQNLNIANTSTGTLDQQAAIYASSWEAASNRIRASWEGLWDNMIDSNSAIEVLDFISKMVDGLDGMLTSLGGAKGVLTTFGGLLTKIFAPKISETIADTAYNIGMMLPGAQKRADLKRQDMLTNLQNAMASGHLDMGSYESRIRNRTISSRLEESRLQSERERSMTDEEKLWDREYSKQLERNRDLQVQNAQEIDAAANARANLAIDDIGLDKLDSEYKTGGQLYRDMALAGEKAYDDSRNYSDETREEAFNRAVDLEKQYYDISRKQSSGTGKTVREMFNETFKKNQEFLNTFDTNDIDKAKESIKSFAEETGQSVKNLDKRLNEFGTDEEKKAFLDQYAQKLVNDNRDRMIKNMDIDSDEDGLTIEELDKSRQKYRDYYDRLAEIETKKQRGEQLTEQEQNIINERNKLGTKKVNWSDAFVGASQGLWASVAALEALKSFANDPSLLSLAGMVGNSVEAFDGFNTLFKAMPASISKFSGTFALLTMTFITAADMIGNAIEDIDKKAQKNAEQAATSAQQLQNAYNTNQTNHTQLLNTIKEYQNSESKLKDITLSSKERAEAEYEHNRIVSSLIGDYNLQEEEYSRVGGQLKISQAGLDRITEQSQDRVNASRIAADQGAINAKNASNKAETQRIRDQITESSGMDKDIGNTLLKLGGAALVTGLLAAAIATGIGAIPALAFTAGGAAIGGGMATAAPWLLGAGAIGTVAGATERQIFTEDNFADEVLRITEKRKGDTSWLNSLDSIMAEGFNETQANHIYKYRDSLEQLSSSMKAAELAGEAVAENAARNAVATDEAAKSSSQQSKIAQGATKIYEEAANEQREQVKETFFLRDEQAKFDEADAVKDQLGLSGLQGFNWEDDDYKNKRLTYSYIDESGKIQEGAVNYDSIIESQSSKSGISAVNAYTDQMLQAYDNLKVATGDKEAAGGLFALLTGGDFDFATNKEIAAAQKYLNAFQGNAENLLTSLGMSAEEFSESYGMSAENFVSSWTNYQTASQKLLNSAFSGNEGYREWQANNQDLLDSISQETGLKLYDNLNQISTLGGEDAGMAFLNGLSYILNSEGLDASDTASVMESLMSLDWSSASIGTDITSIISSLGGTIDTATGAWQNFIAAMMEASGAVPDFSSLLSQLTELIGLLGQVNPGEIIDESLLSSLLEKYPEFRDLVMKQWDGSYKFMGSEEDLQEYQNRLNNEYSANYEDMLKTADLLEQYTGEGGALEGFDASKLTFEDLFYGDNALALRDLLTTYTGKSFTDLVDAREAYGLAEEELNQWSQGNEGVNINGTQVFRDSEGNFVDTDGNIVDEATRAQAESQYIEDQTAFSSAMAAIQQFVSILQSLLGMTPDEITQDANEQKASTYDTYSEFEKDKLDKDPAIVDEEGNLTSAGEKQLQSLAQLYPEVSAEAERYKQILEDTNATEQEREDAQQLLEERLAAAEAAKKMGLEYNEVVEKMEELKEINKDNESFKNIDNSGLAELATEALKVDKAMVKLHKEYSSIMKEINNPATKTSGLQKLGNILKDIAQLSDRATVSTKDLTDAYQRFIKKHPDGLSKIMKGDTKAMADYAEEVLKNDLQKLFKGMDWDKEIAPMMEGAQNAVAGLTEGMTYELADLPAQVQQVLAHAAATVKADGGGLVEQIEAMSTAAEGLGLEPQVSYVDVEPSTMSSKMFTDVKCTIDGHNETHTLTAVGPAESKETGGKIPYITFTKKSGGKGPGGGGGGGGGGKEPKKVANQRKSQTVKRYKMNNYRRDLGEKASKSEEQRKDYLYGESKIAQMEKINKLAEKEAKITADRISESRKYLIEDRQNLIKYMQKYGFEAEFDSDGFLANYEEAWTKIYEEIAALYEDNELTEEESKIEEELKIKLEELEGALEDYENSLKELADDIEKWEETMYEMFDNEVEQMEHKVEFKLELDEDSLEYIDYLIENLGDSAVRAIDKIELIASKTDYLFKSIQTARNGIDEIYALSDDPLHLFATGGLDIDGLLTESQVEALREQSDSLIDFADQLREIRDTIQEQVAEVFDMWTEKINHNISTLEHYSSILGYFKSIIDLTGNDIFGLSNDFIRNMETAQINQSLNNIEANKIYYEELKQMRVSVEEELQSAEASGDQERIAYWEEHLRTVTEEMQSAQDAMLSSLENSLSMITDQFTAAMEDAVEKFNESIYASGGLEGLSNDYSMMREQADLMAEDYDKIYNLSKITRNINKTLDDTNIIAGKQRLNKLLQEVNDLQKSNVELSKYDLEYLEAKYQLYLAQVELENAQANKDTVQLQRDSEGNWSYIYTTNEEKVDEAQQKYEDALYEMQNMNHEYMEEMSSSVIDLVSQMEEEIANIDYLKIGDLEEYNKKVEEIRQKYLEQIRHREDEMNKAIENNQVLYDKDWKAYSNLTGYKISADNEWINSFRETTLGIIIESESLFSDFGDTITGFSQILAEELSQAASSYFQQINKALETYDTSIEGFGSSIVETYEEISSASKETTQDTEEMAEKMKEAFNDVVNTVGTWQDTDGLEIVEMLDRIATYLEEIFAAINKSANLKPEENIDIIGQQEAVNLINKGALDANGQTYDLGQWKFNKRGDIDITYKGETITGSNFVDFNAKLIEEVEEMLDAYYSNPTDAAKAAAEEAIKKYWAFRNIVNRVYDPGEIEDPTGFDTGGYTGEWGREGKIAMLHEKELILNPNDTSNFLEALDISRQLIEMIEMNARASSLGLGEMVASTIKDTSQIIEQQVSITAEFPNATDHSEIEEAFDNLINIASQYAYRSE